MSRRRTRNRRGERGFTLFEALVAIALMGLILGALASVSAQWLPTWSRGLVRAQRNEQIAIALDRMAADLAAAEYISASQLKALPLFTGSEFGVIFVRSVLGPNSRPGLEIVRIAEINDGGGPVLVRTRAPFTMLPNGGPPADPVPFADPVVLLRPPFRIGLSYAGPDGAWVRNWRGSGDLPAAVRFDVRDVERGTVMSTAARVRVEMAAPRPDPSVEAAPADPAAQSGNGRT